MAVYELAKIKKTRQCKNYHIKNDIWVIERKKQHHQTMKSKQNTGTVCKLFLKEIRDQHVKYSLYDITNQK